MSSATRFDFAPLAAGRIARAGGAMDGACEIQFCRRQQRSRPGAGRRPDRRGQRRAQARGQDARDLRPCQRPAGLSAFARISHRQAQARRRHRCTADDILIVSGSLQALDLVNQTLLARGDTVIVEQETYQGALNRLTRLGVNAVGIPLDDEGMRMDALAAALADLKSRGIRRNTSTPSRPCRTRPAPSCRRRAAPRC